MNINPNTNWRLSDWLNVLQIQDTTLAERLVKAGYDDTVENLRKHIYDVKSATRRQRIAKRKDAYFFIRCLNQIAEEKGLSYMSCENLREHAKIFLQSRDICSRDFGELSNDDVRAICPRGVHHFNAFGIMHRILPRPPVEIIGRENDRLRVVESVECTPITVICGLAGNGKTTLAWHSVKHLMQRDTYFTEFDWTTDKREIIRPDGKRERTGIEPLNFEIILKSMIDRFGWEDLSGAKDHELLAECAHRLNETPYLIVIDNLETVDDSEAIVEDLIDLLGRAIGKKPVSHAIITSRHRVEQAGCRAVRLHGLDEPDRIPYIESLIQDFDLAPMSDAQKQNLATFTNGNPLLMQIGVQRHTIAPAHYTRTLNAESDEAMFLEVFTMLFEPVLSNLKQTDKYAYWLLMCAAQLPVITEYELLGYWRRQFGPDMENVFLEAINTLRTKLLIDVHVDSDRVSMHPFIQSYVRSLPFDLNDHDSRP